MTRIGHVLKGFAGGDNLAEAKTPKESGESENGTKSGVSISFDAWKGNFLPDNPAPGRPSNDK